MSEKGAFYEKLKSLRRESDRVLFSDGGKHWPIFRVKDDLYNDFWPFFERYLKEWVSYFTVHGCKGQDYYHWTDENQKISDQYAPKG